MPRLGGDGEAPQMRIAGVRQPGEQRMAAAGAQRLLRRPQGVAPAGGTHQGEMRQVDSRGGERRRIRQVRRREPDHPLAGAGQPRERGHEQAELADSSCRSQHLGQRPAGPAAAGDRGIELRETRGHGRQPAGRGMAFPDAGVLQDLLERHDTVYLYSIRRPGSSVPLSGGAAGPGRPS